MMWKIALTFVATLLAVGLGSPDGPPGGVSPIDPNDPDFKEAVHYAIKEYNRHSNHHHFYGLERVIKSQLQVVEGENFIMTLRLGKTKCLKGSDSTNCPIIKDPHEARFIECDFTVWSRPWLHDRKMILTGSRCRN